MVQQVPDAHRVARLPGIVDRHMRQQRRDRRVQGQAPFANYAQHANGEDGLGDGADVHAVIDAHRSAGMGIAHAGGALAVERVPDRALQTLCAQELADLRLDIWCGL